MIAFLDASALVKNYVDEPGRDVVRQLLDRGGLAISRLTEIEVVSALMLRVRHGSLAAEGYPRALQALRADLAELEVVELLPDVTALAVNLLERHVLRAGDAVQLASCLALRERTGGAMSFLAFDRRLNDAAAGEGLALVTVG